MMLFAAVVPPRAALEAVAAVIEAVEPAADPSPSPPTVKRSRWRKAGRPGTQVDPHLLETAELVVLPLEHVHLSVARFGNVTPAEAKRLVKAFAAAAPEWPRPDVRIEGGTVQDASGPRSIAARLAGDVDALDALAGEVKRAAQRVGYLLDRRDFRAVLPLITLPVDATTSQIAAVLAALDAFQGETWTATHLSLLQVSFDSASEPREYARFALAASD